MMSEREHVIAGLAGVLGFILTIVGALVAGEFDVPEPTAPAPEIVAHYRSLDFEQMYRGIAIELVGFMLLAVFTVKLAHNLGSTERGSPWGGLVVLVGAILAWTVTLVSYAPWIAGAYRASHGGMPDEGYLLLNDLQFFFYPAFLIITAFFLFPAGILIVRTHHVSVWLAWPAIALAVAFVLAGTLAPTELRLADALAGLWGLWLLAAAILMLIRKGSTNKQIEPSKKPVREEAMTRHSAPG